MKRRIALLVVVGLFAWLAALVATFPAAHAVAWFAPAGVDAAGVSGTVWRGRAARIDPGGPAALTAVEWDVAVLQLFTGHVAADTRFQVAGLEGNGRFARGFTGALEADAVTLRGPAARAGGLLRGVPLELRGQLLLRLEDATLADGRIERLRGRFQWSEAAVAAPVELGLGLLRAGIEPSPERPGYGIEIQGGGGALDVEGGVELRPDGRYSADLYLEPTDDAPDGLRETLGMAAQRDGDGFRIRRSGVLPGFDGG